MSPAWWWEKQRYEDVLSWSYLYMPRGPWLSSGREGIGRSRKLTWLNIESIHPLCTSPPREKILTTSFLRSQRPCENAVYTFTNEYSTVNALSMVWVQDFKGLWERKFKFYDSKIKWASWENLLLSLKEENCPLQNWFCYFRTLV